MTHPNPGSNVFCLLFFTILPMSNIMKLFLRPGTPAAKMKRIPTQVRYPKYFILKN